MVIIRCPITIRRLCFLQAIEGVNVQTAKRYVAAGAGRAVADIIPRGSVILSRLNFAPGRTLSGVPEYLTMVKRLELKSIPAVAPELEVKLVLHCSFFHLPFSVAVFSKVKALPLTRPSVLTR